MVKQNSIVYTYDIFFTYSSIGRHLSWFHKLTTTDAAVINMTVQTLCGMLTYFFEHRLTRMNAESCSSYNFSVYRSFHADFHSGWTNLHSEHLCVFPFPTPSPHKNSLLFVFLVIDSLTRVSWNLYVVLVWVCSTFLHMLFGNTLSFDNYLLI